MINKQNAIKQIDVLIGKTLNVFFSRCETDLALFSSDVVSCYKWTVSIYKIHLKANGQ